MSAPDLHARSGEPILGAILAGGLSSRMGREKAFVELGGKTIMSHAIGRLAPQVDQLVLNANGDPARFARFGLTIVADGRDDSAGPLAGLAAVLSHARQRGFALVATAPSDAPFFPPDLVARLEAALAPGLQAAVAEGPTGLEPLFGLWRTGAADQIAAALSHGERALHRVLGSIPHARVAFADPDAFTNVNTPEDLAIAATRLAAEAGG